MIFDNALKSTINNEVAYSENGAAMFKTSGHALVDLNFAVSSLRNASKDAIEKMFADAFYEDKLLAVKWLFFARDIRGNGMGERRLFRICLSWLGSIQPELVKRLIPIAAEYGRFDDILGCGFEGELWDSTVDYIAEQLKNDISSSNSVSLLAKWLPSCNTSSLKTRALAKKLRIALGMDEKTYRKTLSALRAKLRVVEVSASANEWSSIDYNAVPSMANLKYKNAFLKHDKARREKYLEDLACPSSNAKINSSAAFPCDIVQNYFYSYNVKSFDQTLEAMWKALPNIAINGNVLAVCDGSASMTCKINNTNLTALAICNSLGIYCAEHCTGPFKDKYITFSERPQYVDMSKATSLKEKLEIAFRHDEVANTNLEAVFDLVLKTVVDNNLKQTDVPTLVILSDMEVDCGCDFGYKKHYEYQNQLDYSASKKALMEKIRQRWNAAGYVLPRLIWWNINSRTGVVPLQQNSETGMILCSGYNQTQFKMIVSNKTDPYEVLIETLDCERYNRISKLLMDFCK